MSYLRTVEGNGQLVIEGRVIGPVAYTLDVHHDDQGKYADGRIASDGLQDAPFETGPVMVHRPSGDRFELVVLKWESGAGYADVKATGAFPEH